MVDPSGNLTSLIEYYYALLKLGRGGKVVRKQATFKLGCDERDFLKIYKFGYSEVTQVVE